MLDEALAKDERIKAFVNAWHRGPHHARVIRAQAAAMQAEFPDAVLANYMHWGESSPGRGSPWIESQMWDAPGEAEDALFDLLRR